MQCYNSVLCAMTLVCLSICHKSVFCQSGQTYYHANNAALNQGLQLVLWRQRSCWNFHGITPNSGARCRWGK